MPCRERILVVMTDAQFKRRADLADVDFEFVAVTCLEGIGFTGQLDIIGFAVAPVENEIDLSVGACSFDVTRVDPHVPRHG